MEVIQGKYGGFCPGIKRAWKQVETAAQEYPGSIFVLGELLHNNQALEELKSWGVKTINNLRQIRGKKGILIIRAHGEPSQTFQKLTKMEKIKVLDATCPNVSLTQKLARRLEDRSYQVVVCGEKNHPEVRATIGYTKKGIIISSPEEAEKLAKCEKIGVLSQTTFLSSVFKKICKVLEKKTKEFKPLGTICNFTKLAQKEARKIAKEVDLVIVVGGKHSENTKRLVEVAGEIVPTHHVEVQRDIKERWLKNVKVVGLLAGASTPNWVINEVRKKLEEY